ncbi:MAG: TIGR00266 family protein [Gomphosphaeria aponina SAG 52.96 = DSM 107014]|uniref:TIGR00266 family protein n=1 Tax=Gomphosphaeria aponina SAG 52.96 = DSM 107014 TaxID=1521640 RepID=A0A941GSC9_9CHRO|nr:TIGR00266 family protein [Gomphosphaeria aponina SAG 52.96 = DSM 107014]
MIHEIRYKPQFAAIFVTLNPGDRITAEAGAMVSMDTNLSMKTELSGGFFPALWRKFFGGESLFVNVFKNETNQPLNLVLSQSVIGDIEGFDLTGKTICLQPGAYIAHTPGAKMSVKWAGFASWFAGEGLFKLQFTGGGIVFFGAYGGLTKKNIQGSFIVDNSHLVAYSLGIKMSIALSGSLIGSLTSGEGFVNKLSGQGIIYLQSRSVSGLVGFLRPKVR